MKNDATPKLIIIGGFAGTGKTTLSKKLSKYFSIPRLGVDDLSWTLKSIKHLKNHDLNYYGIAYALSFTQAKNLLSSSTSLIFDINMCNPLSWQEIKKLKNKFKNIQVITILLKCSFSISSTRVEKRRISSSNNYEIGKHNIKEVKYKYKFIEDQIKNNKSPNIIAINTNKKTKKEVFVKTIKELKKHGI